MDFPLKPEIESAANLRGLDPSLVAAICFVESCFQPEAIRYERRYQRKYIDPHPAYHDLDAGTRALLASSLGIMQVMGATAHEDGLPLASIKDLFLPEIGLKYGTIQLAQLFERYQFSPASQMKHAIAAYNAGSARLGKGGKYLNQDYVDKVMAKYEEFKRTA